MSTDHEYTDNIVCPSCKRVHFDSWEIGMPMDSGTMECEQCGSEFHWERIHTVSYSTKPTPGVTERDIDPPRKRCEKCGRNEQYSSAFCLPCWVDDNPRCDICKQRHPIDGLLNDICPDCRGE